MAVDEIVKIINGQKTVSSAGTAEQLIATSTQVESVTIKALSGNTGSVYVGNNVVSSSNGFVLAAGEAISLDIDDLSLVYIDVGTNDDGVSWIAIAE
ncbi:MAG: hypothetical protein IPM48_14875 [Saprospiraceae bacterium]|nr:hypothetical protein [Saprospiraceae bacterium]